jgi:hypothetical protein
MPWSGFLHADTFDPWPEPRSVPAGSRTEPPFRLIRTRNINPAFLARDDDIREPATERTLQRWIDTFT